MNGDRTILVAEDDALARKSLVDWLMGHGFEVVAAEDGEAAWAVLQQAEAPRVVLLDWMMPGLTGLEVLDRLRRRQPPRSTYVILLTARHTPADIVACLDSGAQDFIAKPFNHEELLARVQVAFRTVALEQALAARVAELEQAVRRITQLEGILPICSCCKKIRDDSQKWNTVEDYFRQHAPVRFSHGYCPDCFKREMEALNCELINH